MGTLLGLVALLGCCTVALASISRPSVLSGGRFFGLNKARRAELQRYVD